MRRSHIWRGDGSELNVLGYDKGTTAGAAPSAAEWPSLIEADPLAAPASESPVSNQQGAHWAARLRQAARDNGAYLVPLRLFIGLGWLRACAEKVVDPGWRDGSSLAAFLSGHVLAGDVVFPWYETLLAQVFLPHAAQLALAIVLGQLLAGAAITAGGLTNAALLGGLFMNLNFLLAGAPNPSTFYIVIQVALLLTNAGAILGLDMVLARTIHNPLLVAQPLAARRRRRWRVRPLPAGVVSLVTMIYALPHVTDWSPAGSVEDPAMIVTILALLSLAWATIAWLRLDGSGRGRLRRPGARSGRERARGLWDGAVVAPLHQIGASFAGWSPDRLTVAPSLRSPQQRRLALTVSVAWVDDPDDRGTSNGAQGTGAAAATTGSQHGGWRVSAQS